MIYFKYIFWITITLEISYQQALIYSAFTENILNDIDNWYFINIESETIATKCSSQYIIGGYEKFGQEVAATKFLQFLPHYRIKIQFSLFIIDSWDFGEYFQVYADQNLVYNFEFMDNIATTDLCGLEDFNDQIHDIQFEFDHNGLTSYLYLTSTLDQENTDESWGFRNFRLFLYLCPSGCFVCSTNDLQTDCIVWMPIDSSYTETMPEEFSENGWIIENGLSTQQLCNQIPIICGFDVCGKDTTLTLNLEQLPLHRKMKLKLKYLKFDRWESSDYAILKVDGVIKWLQKLSFQNQYQNACRSSFSDVFINVEITFPHSDTSATIQILNTLDEDFENESFGIRDIQIFIEQIFCGDQIVQYSEDCDDGNLLPFDGCFNCIYSCVDGCSLCHRGICLSCYSGWIYLAELFICQKITNQDQSQISFLIIESKIYYPFELVLQCPQGFQLNKISNQCESICGDNFITNDEECDSQSEFCHECKHQCNNNCLLCQFAICSVCKQDYLLQNNHCVKTEDINICQPQCEICIENICYKCQYGYTLILGQCQEICGNSNVAIYSLEECACDLNCLECIVGICYKCSHNYNLVNNFCVDILTTCGDLIIQDNEDCDDGNDIEFDGCFNCQYSCPRGCQDCQLGNCLDICEYGFYFINDTCSTICGDSILAGNEECEDDTQVYGRCYQCKYQCPENCSNCINGICENCNFGYKNVNNNCINICGDGFLQSKEECDDENQEGGDGCSKTCQIESDWICNQGFDCTFIKYPKLITQYLMQQNQYQYVKLSFSQPVQSNSNICYSDTIQLGIGDLDEALFKINIQEVQHAQYLIVSEVQYILQIEIFTNLPQTPILNVKLTEQLYSSDGAPLQNTIDYLLLNQPNYVTQQQAQIAQYFQMINKVSVLSIYGSSIILIILGNSMSIWGIMDALQQQSYLKFINVLYPQTLTIYFQSGELISIQPLLNNVIKLNMNTTLLEFPYLESYEKFKYYEVNSDITEGIRTEILVFGSLFFFYLITQIAIKILDTLEIIGICQTFPLFVRFLQKLKRKIHYKVGKLNGNFIKSALLACSWDLIFMASLELNSQHDLKSSRSIFRLTITFVIFITTLTFLLTQVTGLCSWKKQNLSQYWSNKKDFFTLIKKVLILLVLVFYQYEQVLQTLILTQINVIYLLYVINVKLYNDQQEYYKNLIMETSLTLFTASTFFNWDLLFHYIEHSQKIIISWIQMILLVSVLFVFMFIELYNIIIIIKDKITQILTPKRIPSILIEEKPQEVKSNQKQESKFQLKRIKIQRVIFVSQIQKQV